MHTTVRDGRQALFWEDRWLEGFRIGEVASAIYSRIPKRVRRQLHVNEALANGAWAQYVGPNLEGPALLQFMELWERVQGYQLQEGVHDRIDFDLDIQ